MLRNETRKILLIVIAVIAILMVCAGSASAINLNIPSSSNGNIDIMQPTTNNTTINQTTDPNTIQQINGVGVSNTVNNTTNNTVSNNTINNVKPTTSNISAYTNSDLPKTGVEDYPLVILMAVCVIAAIYAYIKVRNYNSL